MRALLLALPLLLAACQTEADGPAAPADSTADPAPSGPERATAQIDAVGDSGVSGTVEVTALEDAVEIRYSLDGFTSETPNGFHIHENGSCEADSSGTPAGAAGGHFNPMSSEHGAPSNEATKRHAGDLGNIVPDASGRAVGTVVDSVLAFSGPTSLIGKAVLIHGGEDDLTSQPSGDAGPRIGCGILQLASAASDAATTES
ncbi:MAG: superoxide dismutase family protein [Bacteroidota bacterium]